MKSKENSAESNVKIKNAVRPLKPSTVCLVKKIEVNKKWQEKRSDYLVIYHCGAHQMSVLSESVCVWFFAAIAMLVETFTFSKCIWRYMKVGFKCIFLTQFFFLRAPSFLGFFSTRAGNKKKSHRTSDLSQTPVANDYQRFSVVER